MTLYYEGDTFLHRINPLTKFAVALLAVFHAGLQPMPYILLTHLVVGSILVLVAKPKLNKLVFLGLLSAVVGHFWVNFVLFRYNLGLEASEALYRACLLAARVLIIVLYSLAVLSTTNPRELAVAFSLHLRVPYTYSFMLFVALRMLPLISRDINNIVTARKVRGYLRLKNPMTIITSYLYPLFSLAVRRSITMGIALESRGFGAYRDRTYVTPTSFSNYDMFFASSIILTMFIISLLHHLRIV